MRRISEFMSILGRERGVIGASAAYVAERLISAFVSFFVLLVLARLYPPDVVGRWSLAIAVMQFAIPFLAPAAEPIVVVELVNHPSRWSSIIGSAACLVGFTSVCASAIAASYLLLVYSGDYIVATVALLVASASLLNWTQVYESALRVSTKPASIVISRLITTGTGALLRLSLAFCGLSIAAVAWAFPIEALAGSTALLVFARQNVPSRLRLKPEWKTIVELTRSCGPSMFAGVVTTLFFRVNYVLVQKLSSFKEVAYYSIAFSLIQIIATLPGLAMTGIFPRLVKLRAEDEARFSRVVRKLFFAGALFAYAGSALVSAAGYVLVPVLFGEDYLEVRQVLLILSLAITFLVSGAIRASLINIQRQFSYHLYSSMMGLAMLLLSSYLLIPLDGARGAAFGILLGTAVSSVGSSWILPGMRAYAQVQLLSILLIPPRWTLPKQHRF